MLPPVKIKLIVSSISLLDLYIHAKHIYDNNEYSIPTGETIEYSVCIEEEEEWIPLPILEYEDIRVPITVKARVDEFFTQVFHQYTKPK